MYKKSVMHVQSCFANLSLLLFCRSRCRRRASLLPNTNTVDINCTDIDKIRDGRRLLGTAEGAVAQLFR